MFWEVKVCVFLIGVVSDGSVFTFMLHAEGGSTDVFRQIIHIYYVSALSGCDKYPQINYNVSL